MVCQFHRTHSMRHNVILHSFSHVDVNSSQAERKGKKEEEYALHTATQVFISPQHIFCV
uniref:Uncharacterized protein n=1 Tax=Aegilops tauschii subsp. strangulata TaxID=200361 RepID=A0A453S7F6_AEGTS